MSETRKRTTRSGFAKEKIGHIGEWKWQEGKARREERRRKKNGLPALQSKQNMKRGVRRTQSFIK